MPVNTIEDIKEKDLKKFLVTRDKHFDQLKNFVKAVSPEEII